MKIKLPRRKPSKKKSPKRKSRRVGGVRLNIGRPTKRVVEVLPPPAAVPGAIKIKTWGFTPQIEHFIQGYLQGSIESMHKFLLSKPSVEFDGITRKYLM